MNEDYGSPEMMAVSMARMVQDGKLVFVGVNSPLPFVAVSLARKLHAPGCYFISVSGGVNADPPELVSNTSSAELSVGSASIFDNQELYALNGRGCIDITFLGMAQIDSQGHVNSSFIGDALKPKVRFPGGGGAPAIMPIAKQVILWRADHSRRIFTQKVDFITSTGNVYRVVTPLCIFRKEDGKLVLDSIHPGVSRDELASRTGFDIP
ncbi:MAG: CoA-transferase, partial [Burkholderiaceae bacterium]